MSPPEGLVAVAGERNIWIPLLRRFPTADKGLKTKRKEKHNRAVKMSFWCLFYNAASPLPRACRLTACSSPTGAQPPLGMWEMSEAAEGGATESCRPVPSIQSTKRGGGGKKTTGSVGLCFWLGGNPRDTATGEDTNIPFRHSCKSTLILCDGR